MEGGEELVNMIELELQFLMKQLLYAHLLLSIFTKVFENVILIAKEHS
jgi:ribosome-associated toxin RatA of RatAB toxin-antitoxin module